MQHTREVIGFIGLKQIKNMDKKVREIQRSSSLGQYYVTIVYWDGTRVKTQLHTLEARNKRYEELKKQYNF